jgi:hypothetical protein
MLGVLTLMEDKKDRDFLDKIATTEHGEYMDAVKKLVGEGNISPNYGRDLIEADPPLTSGVGALRNIKHDGLPVAGYAKSVSDEALQLVNEGKGLQERVLRYLDKLTALQNVNGAGHFVSVPKPRYDGRALAIARTHIETAFTFAARAVFQPEGIPRIKLPEDTN